MPTALADGRQEEQEEEAHEHRGEELDFALAEESEIDAILSEQQVAFASGDTQKANGAHRGANKILCDTSETKNKRSEQSKQEAAATNSIDASSILNNKQRLKRFWERRMEMDSRGRGQVGSFGMTPRHRPASGGERRSIKLASSKQTELSPARDCESPTTQDENNNNNNNDEDSCEPGGHVSAELLCEKLLAYEQTQRSEEKAKRRAASDKPEVPTRDEPADASQPMSINPTLCHANSTTTASSDRDEEELDGDQDEEQVANEEFGSSNSSLAGPQTNPDNQQAPKRSRSASLDSGDSQEEISTQSGSVLTVISSGAKPASATGLNTGAEQADEEEEEEEENRTGGRATPTLITSIEDEEQPPPVDCVASQLTSSGGGGGGAESDGSNIGVAFESLHFDDEIKSSRSEQVDEERLLAGKKPPSTLPIPVPARLPLPGAGQVKTTIKLANEEVEEHEEGAGQDEQQSRQRRGDKFGSREVRSVCALITSAISDAGRQVEGYLRSQGSNARLAVATHDQDDDDDGDEPITPTNQQQQRRVSNNHDGEATDEESGFQRAKFVRENASPPPPGQLNGPSRQRAEQVATIGYLADEDEDADEEGEDERDEQQLERCASPRADLSSMFEANVRREIERFESNTALRRQENQPGGCGKKSAGLTEWRIAEEIRLFNEREKELKQRCSAGRAHRQRGATVAPPGGTNTNCQQQQHELQLESIVRFGKTLQIPKPATEMHQPATATSRSIKLTTRGTAPSQPATTISMHKFIASGGKRFVYQTTTQANSSSQDLAAAAPQLRGGPSSADASATPTTLDNHLTKSMSNLSTCVSSTSGGGGGARRQVDYRAVDSLKCKEVPNVAPGLAKKTIETFARLNSESSLNKLGDQASVGGGGGGGSGSMAANLNSGHWSARAATGASSSGNLNNGCHAAAAAPRVQQPVTRGAAPPPTAEWKIQEELREMKAREAELRSLRNQHRQQPAGAAPVKPTPKQQQRRHNPIVANVKSVQPPQQQHQRSAATEPATNGSGGGVGKQRLLARPNRFRHADYDYEEQEQESDSAGADIHLARRAPNGDNNIRGHDGRESAASGDDESDSEHEGVRERIRPVTAGRGGGGGAHAYQCQAMPAGQQSGANTTAISGAHEVGDLAGGSDSLYPIKQTIDSFRKLNQQSARESSGNNNNSGSCDGGQVSVTAHRSASGGLAAADRPVGVNKKTSQQQPPPGSRRKQFVNVAPSVGPHPRPT